jgi:hypothetical protein
VVFYVIFIFVIKKYVMNGSFSSSLSQFPQKTVSLLMKSGVFSSKKWCFM